MGGAGIGQLSPKAPWSRGGCEGIFWGAAQWQVRLSVSTEGRGDPEGLGLGGCPAVGHGVEEVVKSLDPQGLWTGTQA